MLACKAVHATMAGCWGQAFGRPDGSPFVVTVHLETAEQAAANWLRFLRRIPPGQQLHVRHLQLRVWDTARRRRSRHVQEWLLLDRDTQRRQTGAVRDVARELARVCSQTVEQLHLGPVDAEGLAPGLCADMASVRHLTLLMHRGIPNSMELALGCAG